MGLSMANIYTQAMNQAMQSAMQQQFPKPLGEPNVFALVDGKKCGPYTVNDIVSFLDAGSMNGETYIWKAGMADWMKIKDIVLKNRYVYENQYVSWDSGTCFKCPYLLWVLSMCPSGLFGFYCRCSNVVLSCTCAGSLF